MEQTKITIEATITATIPKVWDYWTKPEHITQWNFATPDWLCPTVENDVSVGGKYLARMEAKDGSFGFDFEAVYDEVVPHRKLAYTMTDGRRATTLFESMGETTKVTTTFDAEGEHDAEMQRTGWQAILNNFKQYVESKGWSS